MSKGKFIVIEGIDGCGKGTQVKKLVSHLRKQKVRVKTLSYPDRQGPIGSLIDQYLHREYNFSKEVQFSLYFSDFLKDKERIRKWLREGRTIIADRYFLSTLAYQSIGGFPIKRGLETAKLFDLPKPDMIVFLDINPETSLSRKFGQKGMLDRHEADANFQKNLARVYRQLAKKKTLARWVTLDGEKSKEEIFNSIKKIVK